MMRVHRLPEPVVPLHWFLMPEDAASSSDVSLERAMKTLEEEVGVSFEDEATGVGCFGGRTLAGGVGAVETSRGFGFGGVGGGPAATPFPFTSCGRGCSAWEGKVGALGLGRS